MFFFVQTIRDMIVKCESQTTTFIFQILIDIQYAASNTVVEGGDGERGGEAAGHLQHQRVPGHR